MLEFTDAAREQILTLMGRGYVDDPALRVAVAPGGSPLAPECELSLVEAWDREDGDVEVDAGGFRVLVDAASAGKLDGATVDYVEQGGETGFVVRASGRIPKPTGPLAERVAKLIEERINPAVASHGGQITLVAVEDDVVYIEMSGGCQGCGMAQVTLRQGVERMIRDAIPEVAGVQDVTDHARGRNPYYGAAR